MLGFMATNADVGYYGAAVKIKNILVSIVTSLGTVLLPRAAYYIEQVEQKGIKLCISSRFTNDDLFHAFRKAGNLFPIR